MAQPTLEQLAAGLLQLNESVAAINGNLSLNDYRGPGTWGLGLIPGASDVNQGAAFLPSAGASIQDDSCVPGVLRC